MTSFRNIILGPPGTGKTHKLLDILEAEINAGTRPDRIAFCSFTKKASEEARNRAIDRFNFSPADLPWFRTLHSLAFNRLGLRSNEVMQGKHYREIGKHLNLVFASHNNLEEGLPSSHYTGDRYTFLDGFARARQCSPESIWRTLSPEEDLNWFEFRRYRATLAEYKTQRGLLDFTDMLEHTATPLDVDVVILDEAQDLSTLQWDYAFKVLLHAKRVYIAGDDDQAIFQWSGADVYSFQNIGGETEVLQQSHRIPASVHGIAERIVKRIKGRYPKTYKPKKEQGSIRRYQSIDDLDLRAPGSWLLLARNVFMLESLVALVRDEGLPYCYRGESAVNPLHIKAIWAWTQFNQGRIMSPDELTQVQSLLPKNVPIEQLKGRIWHEVLTGIKVEEREWYIGILRRGEKLGAVPRININTIHGVKGGEADHVALMTDMSNRTWQSYETDPDSEHRVFYVGATRAKQSLHIIQPQSQRGYEI